MKLDSMNHLLSGCERESADFTHALFQRSKQQRESCSAKQYNLIEVGCKELSSFARDLQEFIKISLTTKPLHQKYQLIVQIELRSNLLNVWLR